MLATLAETRCRTWHSNNGLLGDANSEVVDVTRWRQGVPTGAHVDPGQVAVEICCAFGDESGDGAGKQPLDDRAHRGPTTGEHDGPVAPRVGWRPQTATRHALPRGPYRKNRRGRGQPSKPAMLAPRTTARAERIHTTHIRRRRDTSTSRELWTLPTPRRGDLVYSLRNRFWLPYRRYAAWSAFLADPEKRGECSRGVRVLPTTGVCNKEGCKAALSLSRSGCRRSG